jgi:hypothetical protein
MSDQEALFDQNEVQALKKIVADIVLATKSPVLLQFLTTKLDDLMSLAVADILDLGMDEVEKAKAFQSDEDGTVDLAVSFWLKIKTMPDFSDQQIGQLIGEFTQTRVKLKFAVFNYMQEEA